MRIRFDADQSNLNFGSGRQDNAISEPIRIDQAQFTALLADGGRLQTMANGLIAVLSKDGVLHLLAVTNGGPAVDLASLEPGTFTELAPPVPLPLEGPLVNAAQNTDATTAVAQEVPSSDQLNADPDAGNAEILVQFDNGDEAEAAVETEAQDQSPVNEEHLATPFVPGYVGDGIGHLPGLPGWDIGRSNQFETDNVGLQTGFRHRVARRDGGGPNPAGRPLTIPRPPDPELQPGDAAKTAGHRLG